jgi:uncharacterized protein involved in tolerance to divalent cations
MLIVLTTTPNPEEAENLAEKLVAEKLAACVQVLPPMKSFYFWEGAIQKDAEHLLLIKTLDEKFEKLYPTKPQLYSSGNCGSRGRKSFRKLSEMAFGNPRGKKLRSPIRTNTAFHAYIFGSELSNVLTFHYRF